jgi:hypothetical protein
MIDQRGWPAMAHMNTRTAAEDKNSSLKTNRLQGVEAAELGTAHGERAHGERARCAMGVPVD